LCSFRTGAIALYLLRAARSCAAPIILRRYEKRFVAVNPLPHVSWRPVAIMTRLAALTRLFMDAPFSLTHLPLGVLTSKKSHAGKVFSRRTGMSETTTQSVASHPLGEKLLAALDKVADGILMLRVNTVIGTISPSTVSTQDEKITVNIATQVQEAASTAV